MHRKCFLSAIDSETWAIRQQKGQRRGRTLPWKSLPGTLASKRRAGGRRAAPHIWRASARAEHNSICKQSRKTPQVWGGPHLLVARRACSAHRLPSPCSSCLCSCHVGRRRMVRQHTWTEMRRRTLCSMGSSRAEMRRRMLCSGEGTSAASTCSCARRAQGRSRRFSRFLVQTPGDAPRLLKES